MPVTPTAHNYAAFAAGYAHATRDAEDDGRDPELVAMRADAFESELSERAYRAYRAGRAYSAIDQELRALGVRPHGIRAHYRTWTKEEVA